MRELVSTRENGRWTQALPWRLAADEVTDVDKRLAVPSSIFFSAILGPPYMYRKVASRVLRQSLA